MKRRVVVTGMEQLPRLEILWRSFGKELRREKLASGDYKI